MVCVVTDDCPVEVINEFSIRSLSKRPLTHTQSNLFFDRSSFFS